MTCYFDRHETSYDWSCLNGVALAWLSVSKAVIMIIAEQTSQRSAVRCADLSTYRSSSFNRRGRLLVAGQRPANQA